MLWGGNRCRWGEIGVVRVEIGAIGVEIGVVGLK